MTKLALAGVFAAIMLALIASYELLRSLRAAKAAEQHCVILGAIFLYKLWCGLTEHTVAVDYEDVEDFEETAKKVFDWEIDSLLPIEKMETIRTPFLYMAQSAWDKRKDRKKPKGMSDWDFYVKSLEMMETLLAKKPEQKKTSIVNDELFE